MEQIIDGLLNDFERGRMTRRQLIQSLALAAVAAAPAGTVLAHGAQKASTTEKVKAELERRGLNPRPDMVGENFKSFHVLDPDGWDLQISNQTKDTRG